MGILFCAHGNRSEFQIFRGAAEEITTQEMRTDDHVLVSTAVGQPHLPKG